MGVIILNKQEYVLTDRALRFQPLNCLNENNKSQKLMTAQQYPGHIGLWVLRQSLKKSCSINPVEKPMVLSKKDLAVLVHYDARLVQDRPASTSLLNFTFLSDMGQVAKLDCKQAYIPVNLGLKALLGHFIGKSLFTHFTVHYYNSHNDFQNQSVSLLLNNELHWNMVVSTSYRTIMLGAKLCHFKKFYTIATSNCTLGSVLVRSLLWKGQVCIPYYYVL